jgi:hypothetical protein
MSRGSTRATLLVILAVVAVAALLAALTAGGVTRGGSLDPDSPRPTGARAVARVLAHQGVGVEVVRDAAAFDAAALDARTTLLVTGTDALGRTGARRVAARSAEAGATVLAAPGPLVLRALGDPVQPVEVAVGGEVAAGPGCRQPAVAGLTVEVDQALGYRPVAGDPERAGAVPGGCFTGPGDTSLLVAVPAGGPGPPGDTDLLGADELLSNDAVTSADNAAAALRLLGRQPRLVWYVPDPADVRAGDGDVLTNQLPTALFPGLGLLTAALVALLLWRGRRLGPLVVEPLPVVVRAIESTHGRGRLYRRVRDRPHAATLLRAGTVRRLREVLRLPPGDLAPLLTSVASLTGRSAGELNALLVTRPVHSDADLTRLAHDLAVLEKEITER